MKNGKNQKINEKENCNRFQKTKLGFNIISKKILFYFIIINSIIQTISTDTFTIRGTGSCNIYFGSFSPGSSSCSLVSSGIYNCDLTTGITINFSGDTYSAHNMFQNCDGLISIDLSSEKLIDTNGMFQNCINLKSVTFESFRAPGPTNMSHMFYNCSNLSTITFGTNFNTENVIDMSYMFTNCSSISTLDLGSFLTNKVQNMSHMFELCTKLETLKQNFDTSDVINMEYMFSNCNNLKSLNQ